MLDVRAGKIVLSVTGMVKSLVLSHLVGSSISEEENQSLRMLCTLT